MSSRTVEVSVDELTLGMYVAELDRPWVETPFLFQGFRITEQDELDTLRRLCSRVRIHVSGEALSPPAAAPAAAPEPDPVKTNEIFSRQRPRNLEVRSSVQEEMAPAKAVHRQLAESLAEAMEELRSGRALTIEKVRAATGPLVDSIDRNPDALAWLSSMQRKDAGMYRHAVSAAVLVLTYGRHLGLPRPALESLALGGLLFDVGKTRVPDSVLLKPDRLTDREFAEYQRHVEYGVEILSASRGIAPAALTMVRTHHERHDGSGYPLGLKGDGIPAFGKIAGIADAYQTMLDSSAAGRRLSPHDVLQYLNKCRGQQFDAALVEEFIQAIGIYPTGTLVRLSDGSIGVVVEQNRRRRLQPKVMLVLDRDQRRLAAFRTIDLLVQNAGEEPLQIVECLEAGAYGIDPEELYL